MDMVSVFYRVYKKEELGSALTRSAISKFNKNKEFVVLNDIKGNHYVIRKKVIKKTDVLDLLEKYFNYKLDTNTMMCVIVKHKRKIRLLYFDPMRYCKNGIVDADLVEEDFNCKFAI